MPRRLARLSILAVAGFLVLSGCESREEKAERFYQSALQLIEDGDEERAMVELRNVFQNDGFHKDARQLYADLLMKRGELGEAYAQYLRLVEQYPDLIAPRQTLAELAIAGGDWEEAERHGAKALELAPDDLRAQAVGAALRYRTAVLARDEAGRDEAARRARDLLAQDAELSVARRVLIDWLVEKDEDSEALQELDLALAAEPRARDLQILKFRLLAEAQDIEGTGAQLRSMYELFPDDEVVREALLRWYLVQGDLDGAESLLRELAGDLAGPTGGHLTVVQFLQATQGADAARAELDRLISANEGSTNAELYRAAKAGLDFDQGRQAEAVAALEAILSAAEPSDQTRQIKTGLARMLSRMGNLVGARSRVEEVLAEDPTQVDALKLRAAWAINEDRSDDAILDLRAALSQSPDDVEVLTLMAEAHERAGDSELAGERLAAAAEAANGAPGPSLRYAEFLLRQGQPDIAESVMITAHEDYPADLQVSTALGRLWLGEGEIDRVEGLVAQLRSLGTQEAEELATRFEAGVLFARERPDDGLQLLQSLVGERDAQDIARVVQAMVGNGRAAEAREYLDAELAKAPQDVSLRLIDASLREGMGEVEEAERVLRGLLAEDPTMSQVTERLYGILNRTGRADEAAAVLEAGIAARPDASRLLWIKAGRLERAGDIAGAIGIYEALYAQDSSNVVVANNLASLLSQQSSDPEDLDRAFAIARRLEGTTEPAFQDTYGWLLSQRGLHDEALAYLEPAAAALSEDPVVQFHLGMTYLALGRPEDARAGLERVIELAGDRPLPQAEQARAALAEIGTGAASSPGQGGSVGTDEPAGSAPAADDAGSPDEEPDKAATL
jgi:tetratricopeptide (TPR) repeat protein